MIEAMKTAFEAVYGKPSEASYFTPGRINLIGEHIDYNGGNVFPCAISQGTYALTSKRNDRLVRFYSMNFEGLGILEVSLDDMVYDAKDDWANYPKGVFAMMQKDGVDFEHGLDILYHGNIPNGAGLSSSASIEVLTCIIARDEYGLDYPMVDLVKLSQRVENDFVGVNSGIMDQFAVGMGKKDSAILLNTDTLEYEYVPVVLENQSIVIMNTNKRRGLADSKYNERRAECEAALELLQKTYDVKHLCELSSQQLEAVQSQFTSDTEYRRARHAITEQSRVEEATRVLREGNLERFGSLMNASHVSLRDDYEVTGIELDTLVAHAWDHSGCIGARVTGAGFGGCAIAIVENDAVDSFIEAVGQAYAQTIGYEASFYIASIGQGAHKLS